MAFETVGISASEDVQPSTGGWGGGADMVVVLHLVLQQLLSLPVDVCSVVGIIELFVQPFVDVITKNWRRKSEDKHYRES